MNRYKYILLTLLLISATHTFSQNNQVMEFNNRPIIDVLAVLGELSGKNIIPDNTINGNASFYFSADDFDQALDLFLKSQQLYISEWEGVYKVSKIHSFIDENGIDFKCKNVDIQIIIEHLIDLTGTTILYDNLPRVDLTININNLSILESLEVILKRYSDYEIEENSNYYYLKRSIIEKNNTSSIREKESNEITIGSNGLYSINIEKVRFTQLLAEFFNKSDLEYFIQGRNDNIIENLSFHNKNFQQMLELILEAGSSDYSLSNNIYYIYDINQNELQNRHIASQIIQLKNIRVKDLVKILPSSYMTNNVLKVDEATNTVIISGTEIKTEPIYKFIEMVDLNPGKIPRLIKPDFVSADLIKNVLLKQYSSESIINIDSDSFLILLTDEENRDVIELIKGVDKAPQSHLITLKYITSETFFDNLPKSISEDSVISTPNPSVISYYGTIDGFNHVIEELEKIDKPTPQIKYKVLVIQSSLGDDFSLGLSTNSTNNNESNTTIADDDWYYFSGTLGALLDLNFDILSSLGPLFSMELDASIKDNRSKILVDTTLQALSGKEVSFRNTTTTRFYQTTVDADGETESTGATQEVSWGIILDIEGWTSGDGMVTVDIDATLSDETNLSEDSSGIPTTTEKIVKTEIRTREGKPVVISGLISSKKEKTIEKTPLLGSIPLLGLLFRKTIETETQSEFTIYLLPYVEQEIQDLDAKLERAYKEFF